MLQESRTVQLPLASSTAARRLIAVVAGTVLVALSAQLAVPLPGTAVPLTFQGAAVVLVGGLLGARLGAASLALYLVLGAAGLPVFAPIGAPGFARLIGPTGGYLLAMPLAAALAGHVVRDGRSWARIAVGLLAGLAVIHLGGVAQLAILTGDARRAVAMGTVPFWLLDFGKLLVAGLIVRRMAHRTRALV
jgi:biotin transport system substrate-specific component